MHVTDGALDEAALAVGEVELPHTNEPLGVAQLADLGASGHETLAPVTQGQGIARADVLKIE